MIVGDVHQSSKSAGRDNDRIDIGILDVTSSKEAFLRSYSAVDVRYIDCKDIPADKKYYAFIGYPSSRCKPIYGSRKMKMERWAYWNSISPPATYSHLGLEVGHHIIVPFDRKRCVNRTKKQEAFANPQGISGGGVWLVEDLNQNSSSASQNRLVGIGIEYHKDDRALVGVNIGSVISAFGVACPDLISHLPATRFKPSVNG